jgi:Xaa-Pro aminopeptidase
MSSRPCSVLLVLTLLSLPCLAVPATAGLPAMAPPDQAIDAPRNPAVLTLREQASVYNGWLDDRLTNILPALMREEGFDMWLVICRENVADPVFLSLVPFTQLYVNRTTMLVFFDRGAQGVERLTVSRRGLPPFYTSAWEPEKTDQWTRLAQIIAERNPRRIGIDESDTFNYGDGLSATMKKKLLAALPPAFHPRLASAEHLAMRWLERRSAAEIETYHHIVASAHAIIAEGFSNAVITPGVTTTDDLAWWLRQRSLSLGFVNWFQPDVEIQRPNGSPYGDSNVIHRGDLLHCDFGIVYLGLCTDTQQMAYVLNDGESDAPKGLIDAFARGNRLQDILLGEMKTGLTGNQILAAARKRAIDEGLRPSIYSHPVGFHGHAAGMNVGLWDMQGGVPALGEFRLHEDTAYAIELNVTTNVPEWGSQDVRIPLEQNAVYTKTGPRWLDVRQTKLHLVR